MTASHTNSGDLFQLPPHTRPKILMVDDQPTNLLLLGDILAPCYDVIVARSAAQAREAMKEQLPDMILLDVMMPGMDGFKYCRELKREDRTRHIPVIFITALFEEVDELKGFELGAVDFIRKPISPPLLLARIGTHMELKRRTDLLEQRAMFDALTGVGNRRAFDKALQTEWRRLQRSGRCFSMLMVDVDEFKHYNDHFGHGVGDRCLQQVATLLRSQAGRAADHLARYGGEEFTLLLPETPLKGAIEMAERILSGIRDLNIKHSPEAGHDRITVSIGVTSVLPDRNQTPDNLFRLTDHQLYKAKQSGRDRICYTGNVRSQCG